MALRDYEARWQFLRQPAREATEAYETGTRWFDQMKELLLIEGGLVHLSEMFHRTAHWFPTQFDVIGDILHQRHVIQDYGATPEFPGVGLSDGGEIGTCFELAMRVFEEIEQKLKTLIRLCDAQNAWAIARQFENLQIANSKRHERFLYAWKMYEEAESASSFDNWVLHLLDEEETEADA